MTTKAHVSAKVRDAAALPFLGAKLGPRMLSRADVELGRLLLDDEPLEEVVALLNALL